MRLRPLTGRLPWWLHPWGSYRGVRRGNHALLGQISLLRSQLAAAQARNAELGRRIEALHAPMQAADGAQVERMAGYESPGTGSLQFVICATGRGNGRGIRLYASHKLAAVSFGMTEASDPPPRYRLRATFGRTDVVDKPSAAEALDHLAAMWRSRDGAPDLPGPR